MLSTRPAARVRPTPRVSRGERALIVGSGPIGVGAALFAGLQGAEVTVIDSREDRLNFARKQLTVPHTILLGEGDVEQMKALTNGEFFTHVFDCTGDTRNLRKQGAITSYELNEEAMCNFYRQLQQF